jgi:hypothetical protein
MRQEQWIRQFADGTLPASEREAFDRLFESDPHFSQRAVEALGARLGPAPEDFLDRVTAQAKPGLERAWKTALPLVGSSGPGGGSLLPTAALAGAFLLLLGTGAYLFFGSGGDPRPGGVPALPQESSLPTLTDGEGTAPTFLTQGTPGAKRPSKERSGAVREGTAIRIQDLPADPSVTVDILDAKGRVVRRLYRGPWAERQVLDWDGRDASGAPVDPGSYRARVTTSKGTFLSEFSVQ